MIEILEEGKITHKRLCLECHCYFKYNAEDVTRRTVWDDHGGHYPVGDFYEIECPFCSQTMQLGDSFTESEISQMKHIDN